MEPRSPCSGCCASRAGRAVPDKAEKARLSLADEGADVDEALGIDPVANVLEQVERVRPSEVHAALVGKLDKTEVVPNHGSLLDEAGGDMGEPEAEAVPKELCQRAGGREAALEELLALRLRVAEADPPRAPRIAARRRDGRAVPGARFCRGLDEAMEENAVAEPCGVDAGEVRVVVRHRA